jgi:hypothetical protein
MAGMAQPAVPMRIMQQERSEMPFRFRWAVDLAG